MITDQLIVKLVTVVIVLYVSSRIVKSVLKLALIGLIVWAMFNIPQIIRYLQ